MYSHHDIGYAAAASVGNLVWHDANNNGRKDRAEKGIPGVAVRLLDSAGMIQVAATTTGADGSYLFTGLLPGTYIVEVAASSVSIDPSSAGANSSSRNAGARYSSIFSNVS